MSEKVLYTIVSGAMSQGTAKGKIPIGYTVTSYQGVLSALQTTKIVYKDIVRQGTAVSGQLRTRRYTVLTQLGLQGQAGQGEESGFIVNGDEKTYQAVCDLKQYMSFPVNYKLPNQQQKQGRSYVTVIRPDRETTHILAGKTLSDSSGSSFPPALISDNTYKDLCDTLQGGDSQCKIGVGISLGELALQFFKRFFGDLNWTLEAIEKLASKGYLYAQVLLPISSSKAKVLHSQVTVRRQIAGQGPFEVWLPLPLILLNDFSELGKIIVNAGNSTQDEVGGENVKYPLAGSKFLHQTSSIDNLTPNTLKSYLQNDSNVVTYKSISLCNQGSQTQGRVRLYYDKNAAEDIQKQVGKIPQEYGTELFKGQATPESYTRTQVIGDYVFTGGIEINEMLSNVSAQLIDNLSPEEIHRALECAAEFETGRNWSLVGDIGDGQGFSCGGLQFTVKAGGVTVFCSKYKEVATAKNVQIPSNVQAMLDYGISKGRVSDAAAFSEILGTEIGIIAQYATWIHQKSKLTIEAYNSVVSTEARGNALLLSAVVGAVNHLPSLYQNHLNTSGCSNEKNPSMKVIRAEAAHWTMWLAYSTRKGRKLKYSVNQFIANNGNQLIDFYNANPKVSPNKFSKGQWNRWASIVNAANAGNFNLDTIPARGQKPVGW